MRPDVPSLLHGVADALETDAAGAIDDLHARRQVLAAVGILRRVAALVPHLHALLLADADDIVSSLAAVATHLDDTERARLDDAARDLAELDLRRARLDDVDACHQRLTALFDDVVAARRPSGTSPTAPDPVLDAALGALAARSVGRERAIGASIAGR